MTIFLIVTKYLFDMDDLGAGIPCYATTHQIPLRTFAHRHLLEAWEGTDGHDNAAPIYKVYLPFAAYREQHRNQKLRN